MEPTNVLVTGGAGAIGTRLVNALIGTAQKIIILDNLDSGYSDIIPQHETISFIQGSIVDQSTLDKVFQERIDVVFHLAAHFANQNSVDHPIEDLEVNGIGTLRLLEASRKAGVKKFVYASSSCVYGSSTLMKEDNPPHTDTPYAVTKLLGEQYCDFYHKHHKLNTVSLRIFNSFGPGEKPGRYRNVIPNFFAAAMNGKPLTITGNGRETRDFNWVGNTVQGLMLAAEKECSGVINIGSGSATSIQTLAEMVNEITGNNAGIEYKPRRDWDTIEHRRADITKAREVLGYNPEINLRKHLEETHTWLTSVL